MLKKQKKNKGQSTIEFIATFSFLIGFIFLFFKFSLLYTNGYLVHYATFMASRSYLVFDNNSNNPNGGADNDAGRRAQLVFNDFNINKFIPSLKKTSIQIHDPEDGGGSARNLYVGVSFQYQDKFPLPRIGGKSKILSFKSESFLGREPTRSECIDQICKAFGSNCESSHTTLSDNGC